LDVFDTDSEKLNFLISNTSVCLLNNILLIGNNCMLLLNIGEVCLESLIMDKLLLVPNPMTAKKTTPLVLMIFTLMCTLPVAAGAVPTAIAQDDDEDVSLLDDENLATGIVSNVLDGGSGDNDDDNNEEENGASAAAGDDSNTQIAVPVTDQATLALNEGVDVDVAQEEIRTTPPSEDDELPPEDEDVFFCLEDRDFGVLCFGTLDECEFVEALFVGFIVSECEEFETPPSDAQICTVVEDPLDISCDPV
jgi:hypothetical protein